jgi:hypothetical protein
MVRVRELFRRWGSEGGRKRSSILSGEERRAIARQAARARWDRAPIDVRRPLKASPSRKHDQPICSARSDGSVVVVACGPREAAELAPDQGGKAYRCAVLEIWTDGLKPDR